MKAATKISIQIVKISVGYTKVFLAPLGGVTVHVPVPVPVVCTRLATTLYSDLLGRRGPSPIKD